MEIRNRMIRIRVTDEEYEAIKKNAPNGNMSEWLRTFAFLVKPKKPKKAKEVNPKLLYELNKIGVNLNQIAKAINQKSNEEQIELYSILVSIDDSLKELRKTYS